MVSKSLLQYFCERDFFTNIHLKKREISIDYAWFNNNKGYFIGLRIKTELKNYTKIDCAVYSLWVYNKRKAKFELIKF